jgi:hypothetical protein
VNQDSDVFCRKMLQGLALGHFLIGLVRGFCFHQAPAKFLPKKTMNKLVRCPYYLKFGRLSDESAPGPLGPPNFNTEKKHITYG